MQNKIRFEPTGYSFGKYYGEPSKSTNKKKRRKVFIRALDKGSIGMYSGFSWVEEK